MRRRRAEDGRAALRDVPGQRRARARRVRDARARRVRDARADVAAVAPTRASLAGGGLALLAASVLSERFGELARGAARRGKDRV
jgi:hypothetical protein